MAVYTQIHGEDQIMGLTIKDGQIATDAAIALSKLAEDVIQADGGQAFTNNQSMGTYKLTDVGAPVDPGDAVNKAYVDAFAAGIDVHPSVRVATTANLVALSGLLTLDTDVTLVSGDRVLVKDQTDKSENGIYVAASGSWSRATDADEDGELSGGSFVFVEEGATQKDTGWVITTDGDIEIDVDDNEWTQFSGIGTYTAGSGIDISSYTINVEVDATTGTTVINGANEVAVQLNANGAIVATGGTGILVNLTSGGGLEIVTNALKIDYSRFIIREVPGGLINGTNKVFTLAHTPLSGMECVFLNGLLQQSGVSNDYTISTNTITFDKAPRTNSILLVNYYW